MAITMTEDRFAELTDGNVGLCRSCGGERECCEPDARNYKCEDCGINNVFGAEELLIMGEIEFTDDDEE